MNVTAFFIVLVLGVVSGFPQTIERESNGLLTANSETESHRLGIYNGNSTTMNTHRYLVSILKKGTFRCAAVIVSSTWILTSADCTTGLSTTDITVVGSSTDGTTGRNYSVLQIVLHPDYNSKTLDYDFSCIQINGTFYYGNKRAHRLPATEPVTNATMMVAGYGCTTSACTERSLRLTSMLWLPKDTCNTLYAKYKIKEWARLGCVYNLEGSTLCKGDFGDPLVKGQVFYGFFVSASSSGFCTASALPVIVTDVYPVADWVRNVTGAT